MAAACIFFVWKEYQRTMPFRLLRIVAMILLWISLTGLVLKPGFVHVVLNKDILLTYGYPHAAVDSLLKSNPGAGIYRTPDAAAYKSDDRVVSPEEISGNEIHYNVVAGIGLSPNRLDQRDTSGFYFIPAPTPDGIIGLALPEHIVPGRVSAVQGIIHTKVQTAISLYGPGGREDSVVLNQSGSFALRFTPRAPGRFLYRIRTVTAAGVKEEILPVIVQSPKVLRLLILQQFPTAEIRYLKNLLSSQGHQLTIRYQISQSNFRYEYANQAPKPFNRLNLELLNSSDLVIGDPAMLSSLSGGEFDILQKAIHNGLGILFLIDELRNKQLLQRLLPLSFQTDKSDTIHLDGLAFKIAAASPIPDTRLVPIAQNNQRVASGYTFLGSGKSGFQLLEETYRLLLQGKTEAYTNQWATLIEETSRRQTVSQITIRQSSPTIVGQRIDIDLITSNPRPELSADGIMLPMQEDVLIDDLWSAQARFHQVGWHHLVSLPDSITHDVFIHHADAWKGIRDFDQIQENLWKASRQSPGGSHREETSIPPLLFFICFLIAAGLVWLAPKL